MQSMHVRLEEIWGKYSTFSAMEVIAMFLDRQYVILQVKPVE